MINISKERRKFPRVNVEEVTAIITGPNNTLSDKLIDISMGGLSFSYDDSEKFRKGVWVQIEIIRDDVMIEDLPAKIVSDIEMPHSPKFLRRCGVEFGNLNELQKERLSFLVNKLSAE